MNWKPLEKFLPEGGLDFVEIWLKDIPLKLIVKNARRTKLGDFRFDPHSKSHRITIDGTLKSDAFFFVLTHEIAHLLVQIEFGSKVKPHGEEWKSTFGKMLQDSLSIYESDLRNSIFRHALNPKASVGADKQLFQKLFLKENQLGNLVENLGENQKFRIGTRVFQRGNKRKIRYICKELKTGRMFLVNGQAIVDEIINE